MSEDAYARFLASVGANVRQMRERSGLTQQGLADLAGVSQRYIAEIEGGRMGPSLKRLFRLAAALEVEPDRLLRSAVPRRRNAGRPRKPAPQKR